VARAGDYLYVPSISGNTIARFDSLGNAELFAGSGSPGYEDGAASEAQFVDPNGIAVNPAGDTLWITESAGRIRFLTELDNFGTAIEWSNEGSDFQVFPSPFQDEVHLHYFPVQASQLKLELMNLKGEVILSQEAQLLPNAQWESSLNLSDLPAGAYVLYIWENGNLTRLRKLTKERL